MYFVVHVAVVVLVLHVVLIGWWRVILAHVRWRITLCGCIPLQHVVSIFVVDSILQRVHPFVANAR